MIRLPARYNSIIVATVLCDDFMSEFFGTKNLHLRLPQSVLRLTDRHDIRTALIQEDPETAKRCRPVVRHFTLTIPLNRVVIFDELREAIIHQASTEAVRDLNRSLGKVYHANDNRLDCRLENLREVCDERV